jgi:transposase
MMGQDTRSESLFYYFRLEEQVPENHLLRSVDKHIDFGFVRERLKNSYSETGRPSIDPEFLLRILLIGYLYGVSSERKLVEELRMHPAAGSQVSVSIRKFRRARQGHPDQSPHLQLGSLPNLRRSLRPRPAADRCRGGAQIWRSADSHP